MSLPNPITRKEQYLAKAAGESVSIPEEPHTREEMYLEKIAEGGGGGGGTTVIANPSEEATDDLTKIQIGNTVYGIEGDSGGSGEGYSETVLFTSGGVLVTDMVLSDSFNNYDAICILDEQTSQASERLRSTTIFPSSILNSHIGSSHSLMTAYSGSGYFWSFNVISPTLLRATSFGAKNRNPVSVIGIKFGGGLLPDYSTTEQRTGQKWVDGKDIYCVVISNQHVQHAANAYWEYDLTSLDIDEPLWYFARCGKNSSTPQIVFPWVTDYHDNNQGVKFESTKFGIRGKSSGDYTNVNIILWYTKN